MKRILIFIACVSSSLFLSPSYAMAEDPDWVISKECWKDGTVEDCNGKIVERRAKVTGGFPKHVEFWDDQGALVGLSVTLSQPVIQCGKLDGKFVCEFRALDLKATKNVKAGRQFDTAESLIQGAGLTEKEVAALDLDWEVTRVVAHKGGTRPLSLAIPLKNKPRDLRRATLKMAPKEKGTAKFYAVPRVFKLKK